MKTRIRSYVVRIVKIAVTAFLVALGLTASGCASLDYAGVAKYTVKPFTDASGALICCEISVANGKEIGYLKTHIEKRGGDWTVHLEETSVKAFEGQKIAAQTAETVASTAATAASAVLIAPAAASVVSPLLQGIVK